MQRLISPESKQDKLHQLWKSQIQLNQLRYNKIFKLMVRLCEISRLGSVVGTNQVWQVTPFPGETGSSLDSNCAGNR